jgi:tRNA modification GTPase
VVTGEGLDCLRHTAAERIFGSRVSLGDLEPALTRERHRVALAAAQEAIHAALPHLRHDCEIVLGAHQIQQATLALNELIGVVDMEEVLDRVFGSFCVGK